MRQLNFRTLIHTTICAVAHHLGPRIPKFYLSLGMENWRKCFMRRQNIPQTVHQSREVGQLISPNQHVHDIEENFYISQ